MRKEKKNRSRKQKRRINYELDTISNTCSGGRRLGSGQLLQTSLANPGSRSAAYCHCNRRAWKVKLAPILLLGFPLMAVAQTNLPAPPMPTMGAEVEYNVICDYCEKEARLVPKGVTIHSSQQALGGKIQKVTLEFACPKCQKTFYQDAERWVRAPIRIPVKATNNIAAGPSTNSLPQRKK